MKRYNARQLLQIEAAKQALVEGFEAFLGGQPVAANSHDSTKSPAAHAAWRAGWLQAEASLRPSGTVATAPPLLKLVAKS